MKGYWIVIISLWSCCWSADSYAQTINWGPAYARSSVFNEQQVVQANKEGIYALQHYKNPEFYFKYKAVQYDKDFNQRTSAAPLEFFYKGKPWQYQDNQFQDGQWRFYYTYRFPEEGKEMLYWTSVNPSTLMADKTQELISSTSYSKALGGSQYRIGISNTKQTFLYGFLPQTRKQLGQLLLQILEEKGNLSTTRQVEVPQEASLLEIEDVQDALLTKDGTLHVLCKFYHSKSRKEEKKIGIPYHYALLTVDAAGKRTWRDSLDILTKEDSALVVSARLYQDLSHEQVFCVGSYKTPSSGGLFQWATPTPQKAMVLPYPTALWRVEEARTKKKKVGLKSYKIKQWLPQTNGTYLAIAEQHYTKVYWDKSEGKQALHQLHDILVIKWDAQGQRLWYHTIAKRQRGGGEGYTNMKETWYSYAAFQQAGQIHLFYNELPENENATPETLKTGYYNQPKNLDFWHYRLDEATGELLGAKPLAAAKDWLVYPQKMQLLPNGQFLLAALQPAAAVKEKALLRWGQLSLEETE